MDDHECNHCNDTGINRYENYHANSVEVVIQPCPFCERGKHIPYDQLPPHEWEYHNVYLEWEDRYGPIEGTAEVGI